MSTDYGMYVYTGGKLVNFDKYNDGFSTKPGRPMHPCPNCGAMIHSYCVACETRRERDDYMYGE